MNRQSIRAWTSAAAAVGLGLAGLSCTSCGTAPVAVAGEGAPSGEQKSGAVLGVGDLAPAITVDAWVKGEEVREFERGRVYVVEFWATWCAPCRWAMPHLTKIARDYRGVLTVIGVASSEPRGGGAEDRRLDNLEAFVQKQGEKMDYTVAYDSTRAMGAAWMIAAGQKWIPTAFIVGADGRVAFIGEPDGRFDEQLERAVSAAKKGS